MFGVIFYCPFCCLSEFYDCSSTSHKPTIENWLFGEVNSERISDILSGIVNSLYVS